jgi:hypothetical protein
MGVRDTIAKAIMGIKAFHSSPHDFDKFDLKKIGTGEGAQAYGHGLYFAENPAVSGQGGQYWNQFVPRFEGAEGSAAKLLQRNSFDREAAIANAKREVDQFWNTYENSLQGGDKKYTKVFDNMEKQLRLLESGAPVGPRTYEVNIKADPAQMLDWDKGLAEQSGSTRDALRSVLKQMPETHSGNMLWQLDNPRSQTSGANVYDFLASGNNQRAASAASLALREAGIPGIKYLDEGSRALPQGTVMGAQQTPQGWVSSIRGAHPSSFNGGTIFTKSMPFPSEAEALQWATDKVATKPTSNYVVFDPANIDILKKYGVVGAPAGALGATYDQSQYEVQP